LKQVNRAASPRSSSLKSPKRAERNEERPPSPISADSKTTVDLRLIQRNKALQQRILELESRLILQEKEIAKLLQSVDESRTSHKELVARALEKERETSARLIAQEREVCDKALDRERVAFRHELAQHLKQKADREGQLRRLLALVSELNERRKQQEQRLEEEIRARVRAEDRSRDLEDQCNMYEQRLRSLDSNISNLEDRMASASASIGRKSRASSQKTPPPSIQKPPFKPAPASYRTPPSSVQKPKRTPRRLV